MSHKEPRSLMTNAFTSRTGIALLLLLVVLLVYGNTFRNDWTYDDQYVVVNNPDVSSLAGFFADSYPGRPMRELSYMLDYRLFGTRPAGYHVQQILWHVLNGVLLVAASAALGIRPLPALLGALLFLLHPLQAESVANIGHRKELLGLFFTLAAFLGFLKGGEARGKRRMGLLVLSLLAWAGALHSYESALVMPLVLVLYEALFVAREKRLLLRRPVFVVAILVLLLVVVGYQYRYLFSQEKLWGVYSKHGFGPAASRFPYYMGTLKAFGIYLGKILYPVDLAPEYVLHFSAALFQPWSWLALVLLVGMVALCYAERRRNPALAFGIGWFLLFYLPVSNMVPAAYLLADRYMYFCLAGLALAAAGLLQQVPRKALVAWCCLLAVLGLLTVRQNGFWRDEHTLWRHAVAVNPDSAPCQEGAAHSYLLSGDAATALKHARKAVEVNRYSTRAYLTLARLEEMAGNLGAALASYEVFARVGNAEYPEQAAAVREYLPALRGRIGSGEAAPGK